MTKALIFANGRSKNGEMVRLALQQAEGAQLIAADGGARIAQKFDLTPHVIIGDMDSLEPDQLAKFEAQGAKIFRYPAEKNETDLELALIYAAEQGATWIRIIGAVGGRFDQMLANVYLLALPQLAEADVAIVARKQLLRLLKTGSFTLAGEVGDTISLIPVSGDVTGVTTESLKYALNDDTLRFGPARGVSNLMVDDTATITIRDGILLCVHTKGRA